jgi:hypothetical protein
MESLRALAPYLPLRYEDLCSDPETELARLFEFLQIGPESVVTAPRYAEKHHLIGNNMLRTFDGRIELDTRWRAEMSVAEQRTVLDCAGEFARRMGYDDRGLAANGEVRGDDRDSPAAVDARSAGDADG